MVKKSQSTLKVATFSFDLSRRRSPGVVGAAAHSPSTTGLGARVGAETGLGVGALLALGEGVSDAEEHSVVVWDDDTSCKESPELRSHSQ